MLTNREPDWNIDDLTDTEIYDAICYLEPAQQRRPSKIRVIRIALGVCLAFLWFYWR